MADDDLRIRLRPRGSRSQDSAERARRLRTAMTKLRHRTDQSGRKRSPRAHASGGPASLRQKSLVKVQFVASRSPGRWRAHGRYLGREGAQRDGERGQGFDAEREDIALDQRLDGWQKAGDRRLWKMILSPEQGQRLDLREHTRELVSAMERDLGTRLEWVAIDHHNTTHPHVHLAIRGVNEQGRVLAIPAEYVRHGIALTCAETPGRARPIETDLGPSGRPCVRGRALPRSRAAQAPEVRRRPTRAPPTP